jgi:hypothetical protein
VIPVLWVCGPPGVGKTSVGWEIYTRLSGSGVACGYVDIDQLGIVLQDPPSDPGRHRLKARNLAAVISGYAAAGARCVIVSGIVDPDHGVHTDDLAGLALTMCVLRADRDELNRRFQAREGADATAPSVRQAVAGASIEVDTTGLTVAAVAGRVLERTAWPGPPAALRIPERAESEPVLEGPVLWVCGPTGVGKSSAGFTVFLRTPRAAFVDLDQLGFCAPAPIAQADRLRILAGIWRNYRAAGAQALVLVGPLEGATTATVARLHAGPTQLSERILRRGRGGGSWPQPGDPLLGRPETDLQRLAAEAARDAPLTGDSIETDGRSVEEVADLILARTGWLS